MPLRCCHVVLVAVGLALGLPAAEPGLPPPPPAPVTASSVHDRPYLPDYAFDGDPATRWASRTSPQPEWLQIDLGAVVPITGWVIHWEHAYAAEYEVQASGDARTWRTLRRVTDGKDGRAEATGVDGQGRYLRILCTRNSAFGLYSIWEVEFPAGSAARAAQETVVRRAQEARRRQAEELGRQFAQGLAAFGIQQIVFAVRGDGVDGHWYANFGYYSTDPKQRLYRADGRLCRLDVASGTLTLLVDDPTGTVRDPVVDYDARKVLFSWRPGGADSFHLYEINLDGSGRRQLTDGPYDDIEPVYLPDGDIVFVSSRCRRWVNCWLTPVATLHRCNADGRDIRPLSANIEHDNTPWVLPDGRLLYQRWEYVDRSQVDYHHLWTSNPDGTNQAVYYGNLHPGGVFIDAKPIPGTRQVVLIHSPGHGVNEHRGRIAAVSDERGPDDRAALRNLTAEDDFRDPYALSADWILAARGRDLCLVRSDGTFAPVYTLPAGLAGNLHEPRPVLRRPREPVIPGRVRPDADSGFVFLADVYSGRNLRGVTRGEIKSLLVLESLPKPINYTGGMDPLTYGGSFTLERLLGTVPVEADGSAFLELPANRALFFVALDAQGNSVKRMQSFMSVMPGEVVSCYGCHEPRHRAPATAGPAPAARRLAAARAPHRPQPLAGVPDVLDFPRDVQPIIDRHCLRCHDYDKREGRVILTGDRGPMFSHSYATLTIRGQVVDGRDQPRSNLPPRAIGSSASPLMGKIGGGHHEVKLSAQEQAVVRAWIDSAAPYPGTYAALGGGSIGGYVANSQQHVDDRWPTAQAFAAAVDRRCLPCHAQKVKLPLPRSLSDEIDLSFWRPEWNDPRLRFSRHLLFNLTRPEKSLCLLAPLAKSAGGYGLCPAAGDQAGFANTTDPDYQAMLRHLQAGKTYLEQTLTRFDMPSFRPPEPYVREMKRYGILPADRDPATTRLDVYATDRRYFDSVTAARPPE